MSVTISGSNGIEVPAGSRIRGDFSNATLSDRTMFQTAVANGTTQITVIPNGTGAAANVLIGNSSDPMNSSWGRLSVNATGVNITSTNTGTGTKLPVNISANTLNFPEVTRITGDFSNATVASRTLFQTNVVNGVTALTIVPNGNSTQSYLVLSGGSDPDNAAYCYMGLTPTDFTLTSTKLGTGSYLPISFHAGGTQRMTIGTDGSVLSVAGLIGYGVGAGGTVTQDTNKTQAVTLNKPSMEIKLFRAAWTVGEERTFQVINSLVSKHDTLSVSFKETGIGCTWFSVGTLTSFSGGSFYIGVRNISGSALADTQITLQVNLIKGSIT